MICPASTEVRRPDYEAHGISLYLGDAAEIVPTLTEEVDLLATDPPWGVSFQSAWKEKHDRFAVIHGDRGEVDVSGILNACMRCVRPYRHAYVFGPRALLSGVERLTEPVELIWDKELFGMGNLSAPWGPAHEPINFAVMVPSAARRAQGAGQLTARLRQPSVLRGMRPNSTGVRRHPNEKPVNLMRRLIEASSNLGDVVLDPFMGVGSTMVAALVSGRRAIGIEIDKAYFHEAVQRIERLLPALRQLEKA